ncbi:YheC/YheD family protein [Brevibacillus ruminantium]|uniref:YheC/YheD family protein n=1 Tax=Brevibacillus ruminantium TaxID=2950604 RepID=A0ABY4WNQ7_9BACL|nr:YheC/YheD family protein [Brevibacillus ruminantium]USG67039.1 YheC/YheD family protein [Brevibacillus ruminantium]
MDRRIGILTYRGSRGFAEPEFLRRLVKEGKALGVEVYVFSPQDIDLVLQRINGFEPLAERWTCKWREWPDIVIDHYRYYPLKKHKHYLPIRGGNLFTFANNRFANKFRIHQLLQQEPALSQWLPETVGFSQKSFEEMLNRYPILYVKPTNGSGGRSILRVERKGDRFLLYGRPKKMARRQESLSSMGAVMKRVRQWVEREKQGGEQFFLQQGLDLSLLPGRTVDARLLVQKDGGGTWRMTGMGMRVGPVHSSTSNLHSGGHALPAGGFLAERFGTKLAEMIIHQCKELAMTTVEILEKQFGPMMEFGFDLGIDTTGRVWFIEMNPKPGRDIFRKLGQFERYQMAVRRPLEYALYLLKQDLPVEK